MPRAVQTAEIIAPALGGLEVEQVEDLEERRPGECDGMTWEAYREAYRREGWTFSIYEPLSPGGESFAEFQLRAATTLHQIAKRLAGRTIVVACHGGIIESSMVALLGLPPRVGAPCTSRTPASPSGRSTRRPPAIAASRPGSWCGTTTPPTSLRSTPPPDPSRSATGQPRRSLSRRGAEVAGRVHERDVAERLREVADSRPALVSYCSARRPTSLRRSSRPLEALAGVVAPAHLLEAVHEPERAHQEGALVTGQAVVGVAGS
jgi:hypothetical protein